MFRIDPTSLHTKVARRIFLVFMVCAFFPFAVLAMVFYSEIATYFNYQNQSQLREMAKAAGMAIYERLTFLDTDLKIAAATSSMSTLQMGVASPEIPSLSLEPRFRSLAIIKNDRKRLVLLGSLSSFEKLPEWRTDTENTHLKTGKSLLLSVHNPSYLPAQVFMVRMVNPEHPGEGLLVGEVNDNYLWGLASVARLPNYIQYCVYNHSGTPVMCSHTDSPSAPKSIINNVVYNASGDFNLNIEGEDHLVSYWSLPLKYAFHVPKWTVVLQRSKAAAFGAFGNFKWKLFLVTLLVLGLSLLVGTSQIRTRLVPVQRLREGTLRLAKQDFAARVFVSSGDEFEELAKSFNSMAAQLGQQFHTLSTITEIDRAVLSLLNTSKIVEAILDRLSTIIPCDCTAITLLGRGEEKFDETYFCIKGKPPKEFEVEDTLEAAEKVTQAENEQILLCNENNQWVSRSQRLRGKRNIISLVVEARAPVSITDILNDPRIPESKFPRERGFTSCLALPLIMKNDVLGVLTFFTKKGYQFTDNEIEFVSAVVGQSSVAIYNSQLYEKTERQAIALAKANTAKSEFISVMSHELRTPLNVVMGYAQTLREGTFGEINSQQENALDKALINCNDLLTMINNILTATSLEAKRAQVRIDKVNLVKFLSYLREIYDARSSKQPDLMWDYPSDLPEVKTNSDILGQILKNLLENAIKFTPSGHVVISARHVSEAKEVEFKVKDTGIGISTDSLPVIFDMFRQVDSSDRRSHGGVGLGLYIVKASTELIGGRVEVESEPGKGSTFTITIPQVYNDGNRPELPEPPNRHVLQSLSF